MIVSYNTNRFQRISSITPGWNTILRYQYRLITGIMGWRLRGQWMDQWMEQELMSSVRSLFHICAFSVAVQQTRASAQLRREVGAVCRRAFVRRRMDWRPFPWPLSGSRSREEKMTLFSSLEEAVLLLCGGVGHILWRFLSL